MISLQPACEYIFTGREFDPETQIYYYRARYYLPVLGRFGGRDPIGYDGDADMYAYVSALQGRRWIPSDFRLTFRRA